MKISSKEIADFVKGKHLGKERYVQGVNSLPSANGSDLTFSAYENEEHIEKTDSKVIVCSDKMPDISDKTLIRLTNPRIAFHQIVNEFFMERKEFVHSTAVIEDGADIGDECVIGAHTYIHDNVKIGDECTILPGSKIGVEGNAFQREDGEDYLNNVHKGEVVIEDKVWVGGNCVIDRAVFDSTVIGRDSKLQNLIHVGHNTQIGEHVVINQFCSLAGSVKIGDDVRIHPHVSIANHISVGDGATIAMSSGVLEDVPEGRTVAGTPAEPID